MTVIVYKDGVVAADDLLWDGDLICGRMQKIHWYKNKAIIGSAGSHIGGSLFIKHALAGKPHLARVLERDYTGVIFHKGGKLEEYDCTGLPSFIECDHYAVGSGSLIAAGALAAGKDAIDTVHIVCSALGWPADIHVMRFDRLGELEVIKADLRTHEQSRIKGTLRRADRSRAQSDRSKARQTDQPKHKRKTSRVA